MRELKPVHLSAEGHDALGIIERILSADDPWAELAIWMRERSDQNTSLGGKEDAFIALIVMWLAQLSLPIRLGGPK